MELDFSVIDNLGKSKPQKHTQKAPGIPRARENQSSKELHPINNKSPQKAKYDAKENIFDTFKLQRQEIEREKAYIKKANSMLDGASIGKAEILKAIKAGKPTDEILVIALETLGNISQDETFKKQSMEYLISIQGQGLRTKSLIDKEIEATGQRYTRLKASYREAKDPEDKQRILGAIKAHQERMIELNNISLEASKK